MSFTRPLNDAEYPGEGAGADDAIEAARNPSEVFQHIIDRPPVLDIYECFQDWSRPCCMQALTKVLPSD
jgi:hypothetical protein